MIDFFIIDHHSLIFHQHHFSLFSFSDALKIACAHYGTYLTERKRLMTRTTIKFRLRARRRMAASTGRTTPSPSRRRDASEPQERARRKTLKSEHIAPREIKGE